MNELAYASAADIAGWIRRREVSPVEVMDATVAAIEARNPSLNAFVYTAFDEARASARVAEAVAMGGDPLRPLHGVPVAIKDLYGFRPGWPSTFGGIRALKTYTTDFSSIFVERIEARGGAIVVGKTNSPVMGFRGTCDNPLFGPTGNPFDASRNSGGSSGGSAAAVGDGMVPLAEGTDGGGSIRIPSSWCGVYGFKGSFGRVPEVIRPNAFAGTTPFIFAGPIARTVEDAAIAMSVLAGDDPRDPFALEAVPDFVGATRRSIRGMRIAYSPDFDVFPIEPEVAAVVAQAARRFEEAGAHVEPVKVGITRSQRDLSDLWCRMVMPTSIAGVDRLSAAGYDLLGANREDLPPEYRRWLEACRGLTALDTLADQARRSEVFDAIQGVFSRFDLLLTPTLACLPVKNSADRNTVGPTHVAGQEVDPLIGWCLTYLANFTGHPAASIPAGLSSSGLPIGMQIIGRRYADGDVLAASATFERLQPWNGTYAMCRERPLGVSDRGSDPPPDLHGGA